MDRQYNIRQYHICQPIGDDDNDAKPVVPSASVSQPATGISGYSRSFDGLALMAAYTVRTAEEDSGERRQVMKQNS